MTYQNQTQTMRQKKLALQKFVVSTGFRIGLLVATGVLLTCHVVKMSDVSTKGYEISKLQQQIRLLEEENKRVSIDIARLSSMNHIQQKVKEMQFVPIEKPQYMKFHGSSVVRR